MQDNKTIPAELIVEEWVKKASDDELSCKAILDDKDGAPSSVCFMSQQMAEKYFKAYLVFKNNSFPKIHDLKKLVYLCKEIDPEFTDLNKEAVELTQFYVETRYPAEYPEGISWDMAEEAFKMAERVKGFVKEKILNLD